MIPLDLAPRSADAESGGESGPSLPIEPKRRRTFGGLLAPTRFALSLPPRAASILHMSLAIAVHMAGYELARNATLAMFTSDRKGFESPSALPVAVGFVSPCSLLLLWLYAKILDRRGPRSAIRATTLLFAALLVAGASILGRDGGADGAPAAPAAAPRGGAGGGGTGGDGGRGPRRGGGPAGRAVLFGLFVYQTSSVQLLNAQHWSFVGSALGPAEGAAWFAPIAGLGSVSSTVAAAGISYLVDYLGLIGLLHTAGATMLVSLAFADRAYAISAKHGFSPTKGLNKHNTGEEGELGPEKANPNSNLKVMQKAVELFRRVPTLAALFSEVFLCQCLSSLLSFLFMIEAKETIPDDELRAGWTGNCYAWTNAMSGILQFCVLPVLLKRIDITRLWLLMPSVMIAFTALQNWQADSSLFLAGASFFAMKTIEYSFRGAAMEMLYSSLDYESRYIGKEVITLFANRFGKSGMAIAIFLLTTLWKDLKALHMYLSLSSSVVASLWLIYSHRLVQSIKAKDKVEGLK